MNEMILKEARREELRALCTKGAESLNHRRNAAALREKLPAWFLAQVETRKSLRSAAKREAQRMEIKAQTVKPSDAIRYREKAGAIRRRYC